MYETLGLSARHSSRSTLRKTGQLAQHDATRHECDAGVVRSRRLALVGKVSSGVGCAFAVVGGGGGERDRQTGRQGEGAYRR